MIYCCQFVKFNSIASFKIVPRLEKVSSYGPVWAKTTSQLSVKETSGCSLSLKNVIA